jgi:hypothetical protein
VGVVSLVEIEGDCEGHEFSGDRRRWRGIVRLLKIGGDGEGL